MRGVFSLQFCNIRGLGKNFAAVEHHIASTKPAILLLTETKILDSGDSLAIGIEGYSLIHRFVRQRGLAIYIREDIPFSIPSYLGQNSNNDFTYLWVEIRVSKHTLFLCSLYRSPNIPSNAAHQGFDILSDSIEQILLKSPNAEIVVAGDFNVHNDKWLPYSSTVTPAGEAAEMFAALNHLTQLVDHPTRIPDRDNEPSHLLDLFLTTHAEKYSITVGSPLGNSDHRLVSAEFLTSWSCQEEIQPKRRLWHFKTADWVGLNKFFQEFNWRICFAVGNIDSVAILISTVILTGMEQFIPSSFAKSKKPGKPWYNLDCKTAIALKDACHRKYKTNPTSENLSEFKAARNRATATVSNAKKEHQLKIKGVMRQILDSSSSGRTFWSFARKVEENFLEIRKSAIPPLNDGVNIYTSAQQKADFLAAKFAANSNLPDSSLTPPIIPRASSTMYRITFRPRVVAKVLADINANKSAGPDGIPPVVLKNCCKSLSKPLSYLFHRSMALGIFPSIWKIANVHPVPKKGSKSDPSNYRPIAIVSVLSKVFESIINFNLVNYLEKHNLISDHQYGFRKGRSTGDLINVITEQANRCIHQSGESQVIALDISKAFDRVWHKGLLSKLRAIGLHSSLILWIESFLHCRKIQVVVDGTTSSPHSLNAGVPQGSVLSPTLFLIFINDLLFSTLNPLHSYADDSSLSSSYSFPSSSSRNDVLAERISMRARLQRDLITILNWGEANRVSFNPNKFQSCIFSNKSDSYSPSFEIGGSSLDTSESFELLGLSLTQKISWANQIKKAALCAARCLGYLRRCKFYFTPSELLKIYKTYIRPRLEYNSHIWAGAPITHLAALDRIQARASRIISDITVSSTLDSLSHRRNVGALCVFYKYFYAECSSELYDLMPGLSKPLRTLRRKVHRYNLEIKFSRTNKFHSSFFSRSARMWNRLDESVFPMTYDLQKFKINIQSRILEG